MDCFPKSNTMPFGSGAMDCPGPKYGRSSGSTNCFWDEAIFDCFHDFSGSNHNNPYHGEGNFDSNPANATDTSFVFGSNMAVSTAVTSDFRSEEEEDDGRGYGGHAALQYTDVEEAGPAVRPQEFPIPFVNEGVRTMARAVDHRTLKVREVRNVLMSVSAAEAAQMEHPPPLVRPVDQRAFLMKKKISKSSYGNVYLSVVLKRRPASRHNSFDVENEKRPEDDWDLVEWESTDEFVTITVSPWNRAMRAHRASLSRKREGVVHAIAAMQHIGNYHPHVQGLVDVFQDAEHLYTITKFHGGIDLQTKIIAGRERGQYVPNEPQARLIFSQLLQALFHLQRKGVCHSNLSLDTIFVDATTDQNLVVEGLGRSMRVAYNDPTNFGCIVGESEGTTRRLLKLLPQDFQTHPPENRMYLAPEILENESAFDGFAADIWAAGVVLFITLVGMAPFQAAHYWDAAYAEISSGNLKALLTSLRIHLSDEAIGLLQNMFWRDPRDRLTLAQIMNHPWVKNQRFTKHLSSRLTSSIPRNLSGSHLSSVETASTTSSFVSDRRGSDKSRRSSGASRRSLGKAISGIFGGSAVEKSNVGSPASMTKALGGFLTSSSNRSNHSGSSKGRRSSLGGLSSAASTATAGSPASLKSLTAAEEKGLSPFSLQVLQIPNF